MPPLEEDRIAVAFEQRRLRRQARLARQKATLEERERRLEARRTARAAALAERQSQRTVRQDAQAAIAVAAARQRQQNRKLNRRQYEEAMHKRTAAKRGGGRRVVSGFDFDLLEEDDGPLCPTCSNQDRSCTSRRVAPYTTSGFDFGLLQDDGPLRPRYNGGYALSTKRSTAKFTSGFLSILSRAELCSPAAPADTVGPTTPYENTSRKAKQAARAVALAQKEIRCEARRIARVAARGCACTCRCPLWTLAPPPHPALFRGLPSIAVPVPKMVRRLRNSAVDSLVPTVVAEKVDDYATWTSFRTQQQGGGDVSDAAAGAATRTADPAARAAGGVDPWSEVAESSASLSSVMDDDFINAEPYVAHPSPSDVRPSPPNIEDGLAAHEVGLSVGSPPREEDDQATGTQLHSQTRGPLPPPPKASISVLCGGGPQRMRVRVVEGDTILCHHSLGGRG